MQNDFEATFGAGSMPPKAGIPSLTKHTSGSAVVNLIDATTGQRRCITCGVFGTQEAKAEYQRVVGEWFAAGKVLKPKLAGGEQPEGFGFTVAQLVQAYETSDEIKKTYKQQIKAAKVPLLELYGDTPAAEFGPLRFRSVIKQFVDAKNRNGEQMTRETINKRRALVIRVWKFGVSMEMVPMSVAEALKTVPTTEQGRETEKIQQVPMWMIRGAMRHMSKRLRAMLALQLRTGSRPGEILMMTPSMILWRVLRHRAVEGRAV